MEDPVLKYFPDITASQAAQFARLRELYAEWNNKINLISRKDFDNFEIHHVLHSLAIAKVIDFRKGSSVLDVGTGGGFPGIPLALLFPETEFTLIDSIGKKIIAVAAITSSLGLSNVRPVCSRVEDYKGSFDFIVSRAVTGLSKFIDLTSGKIKPGGNGNMRNGIIYLKGGDLTEELSPFEGKYRLWRIKDYFREPFFETKQVIYMAV